MARLALSAVQSHLGLLFAQGTQTGLTDGQLLRQFRTRRDRAAELAFETLVARHGPMVLGVCRRILNDPDDAADAFQATFLVLVQRAPALSVDGSLGGWLHELGRRVALQVRKTAARHKARQGGCLERLPAPERDSGLHELRAILDEEIARLPERYRAAIVLCDLDGLTHEAAARRLRCPSGTIASRLARGRAAPESAHSPRSGASGARASGAGAPKASGAGDVRRAIACSRQGRCRGSTCRFYLRTGSRPLGRVFERIPRRLRARLNRLLSKRCPANRPSSGSG